MNVSAPITKWPVATILTEEHNRAVGWISTPLIRSSLHRNGKHRVGGRTPRAICVNHSSHGLHLIVMACPPQPRHGCLESRAIVVRERSAMALRCHDHAAMSDEKHPLKKPGDTQSGAHELPSQRLVIDTIFSPDGVQ